MIYKLENVKVVYDVNNMTEEIKVKMKQLLLLSYMGGVTGWHFAIMRHERYAPKLSNYSASPVGRTFPSAAGFITSELFFTDDKGTYIFPTHDFTLRLRFMMAK
jgi:hypothetical protein